MYKLLLVLAKLTETDSDSGGFWWFEGFIAVGGLPWLWDR